MGADFLYTIIPKCKLTAKRKATLKRVISSLEMDEKDLEVFGAGEVGEVKASLRDLADQYPFLDRRDTASLQPDTQQPAYILTGGESWGDSPTEAYDLIDKLGHFPSIYSLLLQYAWEDVKQ